MGKLQNYLVEMANIGGFKGYKIVVYTRSHGKPNFHLKALNGDYEAEFEIPKSIPKSSKEFDKLFLGYKKHKKNYSYKELKNLIKWMKEKSKINSSINNFQMIKIFDQGLIAD